ncbi:MAG: hypothetical protein ACYTXA_30790 [Nostoc sp.]
MSTENSGTESSDRTPHQHWVIFIRKLGLKPRALFPGFNKVCISIRGIVVELGVVADPLRHRRQKA